MDKLIGLIRVSTDKQGESGLGLDAQRAAIEAYRLRTGAELVKTYVEVESGRHDDLDDRPELLKAITHARRSHATLCIARLDRLVRSTVVMGALKVSRVKFVACDIGTVNEFTVDIHVAVAAEEGRKIALRTRDALRAYREGKRLSKRIRAMYPDGVPQEVVEATAGKLGASLSQCRNLGPEAAKKGARAAGIAHAKLANEAYTDLAPWMTEMRIQGLSLRAIAERLNSEGHTTRRGKSWNPVQVKRVIGRCNG